MFYFDKIGISCPVFTLMYTSERKKKPYAWANIFNTKTKVKLLSDRSRKEKDEKPIKPDAITDYEMVMILKLNERKKKQRLCEKSKIKRLLTNAGNKRAAVTKQLLSCSIDKVDQFFVPQGHTLIKRMCDYCWYIILLMCTDADDADVDDDAFFFWWAVFFCVCTNKNISQSLKKKKKNLHVINGTASISISRAIKLHFLKCFSASKLLLCFSRNSVFFWFGLVRSLWNGHNSPTKFTSNCMKCIYHLKPKSRQTATNDSKVQQAF